MEAALKDSTKITRRPRVLGPAWRLKPSILFDWTPTIFSVDDGKELLPKYRVAAEPESPVFVRPRFQDLPSFGMWADRTETDEELLERLRGDWRELGDRD